MNNSTVFSPQEEDIDWRTSSQTPDVLVYAFDPAFVTICTLLVGAILAFILFRFTAGLYYPASQAKSPSNGTADTVVKAQNAAPASQGQADCALSNRFPPAILQWCEVISQYAERHGLPPDLVAALILQESGGNPNAYSSSGAVGLMQIMPSDGLAASFMCANGPCFGSRPSMDELRDPEFNIAYGTRMLASLVQRYGDMREALRSYGPRDMGYGYADIVMGLYQRYSKPAQ
jgi:soluble lytic murein transglycosylase-like protein